MIVANLLTKIIIITTTANRFQYKLNWLTSPEGQGSLIIIRLSLNRYHLIRHQAKALFALALLAPLTHKQPNLSDHTSGVLLAGPAVPALQVSVKPINGRAGTASGPDGFLPRHQDRDKTRGTIRVLIVTGGHGFDERSFFEMFDRIPGVQWQSTEFGKGAEGMLNRESARAFDVIVFYDMNQKRGDWTEGWVKMQRGGKPTVFLHHALGSYPDWPQYAGIVGGHANFTQPTLPDMPKTTYHEDLKYTVHIADRKHPITRGLPDFEVVDEVYNHYLVNSDSHTLLTVDHPESGEIVGWTHRYGRARTVYLLPGHGPGAYENPTYQELVRRAILWSAGKLR